MSYVDMGKVAISQPLRAAHFELPRATVLQDAFKRCVTDYYMSRDIGGKEARGLIITGHSRVGKSHETAKLLADFNQSETLMPDGRPGKIVSCVLSGRVTWKDLGIKTLNSLGYKIKRSNSQFYIWERVADQVEGQGVIGIHYDECQHVFSEGASTNRIFLDSFKAMMKETRWPLMLIISGVPILTKFVQPYEQLWELLDPVHFETIHIKHDIALLNSLLFAFADKADVDIEGLSTQDFLERINHACSNRWGLVIELAIETFVRCRMAGKTKVGVKDFAEVFAQKTGTPLKHSPFTAPDFQEIFDPVKLLELFDERSR